MKEHSTIEISFHVYLHCSHLANYINIKYNIFLMQVFGDISFKCYLQKIAHRSNTHWRFVYLHWSNLYYKATYRYQYESSMTVPEEKCCQSSPGPSHPPTICAVNYTKLIISRRLTLLQKCWFLFQKICLTELIYKILRKKDIHVLFPFPVCNQIMYRMLSKQSWLTFNFLLNYLKSKS